MTSQSQTEFQSQSQQIRAISLKLLSFRPSLGRAVRRDPVWRRNVQGGSMAARLSQTGRVILQPGHVLIARGRGENVKERIRPDRERRHGAIVLPALELGMAVGKREAAGTVVIHAGGISVEDILWRGGG